MKEAKSSGDAGWRKGGKYDGEERQNHSLGNKPLPLDALFGRKDFNGKCGPKRVAPTGYIQPLGSRPVHSLCVL